MSTERRFEVLVEPDYEKHEMKLRGPRLFLDIIGNSVGREENQTKVCPI